MELLKKYKLAIIALLVFVALSFIYVFYFAGDSGDPLSSENSARGETTVDEEFLALLLSLKSLELNTTVLESPEFRSLSDFSRTLISEPAGRLNPFKPFDRSSSRNAK